MRPFAIGGLQLEVPHGDNVEDAIHKIRIMLRRFPWLQMVLLSELAATGVTPESARALPGPAEDMFCELASELGIWLVPGSIYEQEGDEVYNTTPVINPQGHVIGRYRKMFPFQPYEPRVSPGAEPFVFEVPGVGRFGVSICYDLWFPETVRGLVCAGAEVILHPSLTDTIDRDVELAIVRATAAQHQCFVIDINGAGEGGNGRSIVVGPAGDVLHLAGHDEEEIPLEIDLDRVSRGRRLGLRGLGQPLKSLRDRAFEFPHYQKGYRSEYLDSLGALQLPARGSREGITQGGTEA